MQLKQPSPIPDVQGATTLQVLRIAEQHQQAVAPIPAARHVWDSFFVRVLVLLVVVAAPFFLIAALMPHLFAQWGVGAEMLVIAVLIGVCATVAYLAMRPVVAISHAAARVESGDLSVRVVPSGSGEMRLLGRRFNAMLEGIDQIRVPRVWPELSTGRLLTLDEIAELVEAFSDSDLPYKVDLVDWHNIDGRWRHRLWSSAWH